MHMRKAGICQSTEIGKYLLDIKGHRKPNSTYCSKTKEYA